MDSPTRGVSFPTPFRSHGFSSCMRGLAAFLLHLSEQLHRSSHMSLPPLSFLKRNKLLFSLGLTHICTPTPFADICPQLAACVCQEGKKFSAKHFPSAVVSLPFLTSPASAATVRGASPLANLPISLGDSVLRSVLYHRAPGPFSFIPQMEAPLSQLSCRAPIP